LKDLSTDDFALISHASLVDYLSAHHKKNSHGCCNFTYWHPYTERKMKAYNDWKCNLDHNLDVPPQVTRWSLNIYEPLLAFDLGHHWH
jgi:hypothetical protein